MTMHIQDLTDSQLLDAMQRSYADYMYYEATESAREYTETQVQRNKMRMKYEAFKIEALRRGLL